MHEYDEKSSDLDKLNKWILNHITNYKFSTYDYVHNSYYKLLDTPTTQDILNSATLNKRGCCIELNYLFYHFLKSKKYDVYFLKCFEYSEEFYYDDSVESESNTNMGNKYDIWHLALIVKIHDESYYVDTAFGGYFNEALSINNNKNKNFCIKNGQIFGLKKDRYVFVTEMSNDIIGWQDIKRNYISYYSAPQFSYPICTNKVFERVYDMNLKRFIVPTNPLMC